MEELLNVKCETQTGDDRKEDTRKQKEEMRDEAIINEEVIDAVAMLKSAEVSGHGNIIAEMLQNIGEN